MPYLNLEVKDHVAVIGLDQPGEKLNTLAVELIDEFTPILDKIEQDSMIIGVVVISRKPDNFIAGADVKKLLELTASGQIEAVSRAGHKFMERLASFNRPIVAAINGAALGGGLEVALACHYRIATDHPKTVLGLPEVKLGLLPGAGGTQRLPRLISLQRALDMMLTGRNIYPYPAKKSGLVDLVVSPYALEYSAIEAAKKLAATGVLRKKRLSLPEKILESVKPLRRIVYSKARKMTEKQTLGNYPAPIKILECVEIGLEQGMAAGLNAEAQAFEELARTTVSDELIQLFFSITGQKSQKFDAEARPVKNMGVLGAGFMGAGIAGVTIGGDIETILKDIDIQAAANGQKTIYKDLERKVKKRIITRFERDRMLSQVNTTTEYGDLRGCDMVIEAVFEDLELKRRVLADTEAVTSDHCIFASNTSSLPITMIAEHAQRPENVCGMHYFSPVAKMPLLEIIRTKETAEWVIATAVDIGIRQKKTVVVVGDGPGFYTTRILAIMLNEALVLLEEGGEIRHIDRVMKRFGFPVGPVTLMDEVGIDVGAHVTRVLSDLMSGRGIVASDAMQKMSDAGLSGRKNGKGFYHYNKQKSGIAGVAKGKKEVNHTAYQYFGGSSRQKQNETDIRDRLSLIMVNEAARCLEEGILSNAVDGDLGAVMGLGFPPFLGGPFRYIDSLGANEVLSRLQEFEDKHGARFTPAEIVRTYATSGRKFYEK